MKDKILSLFSKYDDIGMFAKEVNGNRVIQLNVTKPFLIASLSKIITAIALYRKLEEKKEKHLGKSEIVYMHV